MSQCIAILMLCLDGHSLLFAFEFVENRVGVAAAEPKTPAKSPVLVKPQLFGSITPFHSAKKCSDVDLIGWRHQIIVFLRSN
ncbi:hypothetical protein CQW23_31207 [Capsicum baccatum]|uniref:Secreted protein n=1 Tax=Capsicum baccatum TaxID=33114 RepID=A0A2G2V888_CAPBA|nr:hypothetical protein CQW23_31207 [Capsicum baccatum]